MTQTKPVIELKNIQFAAFASEETNCYEATLYVDGERWGTVSNEGHGGPDNFHGVGGKNWNDIRELDKRIAETYPKIDMTKYGEGMEPMASSLEIICGDLINEHLAIKEVKSALKRYLLFTKPNQQGVFQVPLKQKGKTFSADAVAKAMQAREPNITVLNAMPIAEAVALYRANAA